MNRTRTYGFGDRYRGEFKRCEIVAAQTGPCTQTFNGLVFTITEIEVTLDLRIITEILAGNDGNVTHLRWRII